MSDAVVIAMVSGGSALLTTLLTIVLGAWVRKKFGKATMPATWEEGYKRLTKEHFQFQEEIRNLRLYIEATDAAIRKQPYNVAREIIKDRREYLAIQKEEMNGN